MRLSTLLTSLQPLRFSGPDQSDIAELCYDSRQVVPGGMFFCWQGAQTDGHRFIPEALERGAAAVVMEREQTLPPGVAGLVVADGRAALAAAARTFFGNPTAAMTVVGVTGTNGKTTVTYLVEAVLEAAGLHPAVLGTVGCRYGSEDLPALRTTPEVSDLLRTAERFRRQGADALVMEVSSHALHQGRTAGIGCEVGVFTNLTPEHLDYHGDMERYFASKARLFLHPEEGGCRRAVVNVDDPFGERLASLRGDALTFGLAQGAVRALDYHCGFDGITARVATPVGELELRSPLLGRFNLANLLAAAGAGAALGVPAASIAAGLNRARPVPGRLERVENDRGALVLVDYAHTGDALENVLVTLRELSPRRLIVLFGCGGDRDRGKRPLMGEIAGRHADLVLLTSDNPRTEDPGVILEQIRAGVERTGLHEGSLERARSDHGWRGYLMIPDRREALHAAVSLLEEGDLLLVAGKGHETYQEIGTRRIAFDDREELKRALSGNGGGAA